MGATPATRPLARGSEALPTSGLVLDRYHVTGAIGAGGHGSVWRAVDTKLERDVALKALPRAAGAEPRRADREARAAARLNHPGIVALYEIGEDDRAVYLVSELVEGQTLAELEAAGELSDRDVAEVGLAICDALAHAHARGVIHRDVKPQNVLVAADPAAGAGFAKLGDFGIARLAGEEPLTATGGVVGTLAYMSPEQAAGREASEASDVYALALTLHEALSGIAPVGPSRASRPLSTARPDLPAELTATIDRCLEARPESRPDVRQLARVLRGSVEQLSAASGRVAPSALDRLTATLRGPAPPAPVAPELFPADAAVVPRGRGRAVLGRALAATATAATALGISTALAPAPPFSPAVAALVVVALCLILPRIGWLATAAALCLWLAAAGRTGAALVVAIPAVATPLLLPRAGLLWPAAALAPVLGAIGLAGAFPALAGVASTAPRRAGLAAAGLVALLAAEQLVGVRLLSAPESASAADQAWLDSSIRAATDVVWPALALGLPLWALAWALLALAAGAIRAARPGIAALAGAALWALASIAADFALAEALALAPPRGAVAAALVGGVAIALWGRLRARERPRRVP